MSSKERKDIKQSYASLNVKLKKKNLVNQNQYYEKNSSGGSSLNSALSKRAAGHKTGLSNVAKMIRTKDETNIQSITPKMTKF